MAQNIMTLPQKRNAMNCFFLLSLLLYLLRVAEDDVHSGDGEFNANPNTAGPNLGEYVDAILIQTKICMRVCIYICICIQTFKQSILYSEFIYIIYMYTYRERSSIIYFNLYIVVV